MRQFSMHTSTSASAAVPAEPPSPSPLAGWMLAGPELTIDVAQSTCKLEVGVGLAGPGMLWMDGLRLEGR